MTGTALKLAALGSLQLALPGGWRQTSQVFWLRARIESSGGAIGDRVIVPTRDN